MIEHLGSNYGIFDPHILSGTKIAKINGRGHIGYCYREVRLGHLVADNPLDGAMKAMSAVQVKFVAFLERGVKKRKTLNVVPMEMRKEDVGYDVSVIWRD